MSVVINVLNKYFERFKISVELQVSYDSPFTCLFALLGEYLFSHTVLEASKHIGCFLDLNFKRIAPIFEM